MTIEECCQLLGVSAGATQDDIKKAFKKRAFDLHPDRGGDPEQFKKLNEAMQVLSGKQKPLQEQQGFNGGIDLNDFFGNIGFDFDPFKDVFFRNYQQPERPRYPEHDREVQINFSITAEDVRQGRTMKVNFQKAKTCDICNGQGAKQKQTCSTCSGMGSVTRKQQQAGFTWASTFPCPMCHGNGQQLTDPCKKCEATGQIVYQDHMIIEIKEKK